MTKLETLKIRLRAIEIEVAGVRAALDELEAPSNGSGAHSEPPAFVWPTPGVDKAALAASFEAMKHEMGIADVEPIGAEALQEQMRQHGIKAEDNIFSRGIIEMREE